MGGNGNVIDSTGMEGMKWNNKNHFHIHLTLWRGSHCRIKPVVVSRPHTPPLTSNYTAINIGDAYRPAMPLRRVARSGNDEHMDETDSRVQPTPLLCSTRLGVSIVGFFIFFHYYAQITGMSVAIVSMVNHTAVSRTAAGTCDRNSVIKFKLARIEPRSL